AWYPVVASGNEVGWLMETRRRLTRPGSYSLLLSLPIVLGGVLLMLRLLPAGVQAQEKGFPPPARGEAYPLPPELQGVDLLRQTDAEAAAKSAGCINCHQEARDPHYKNTVRLGCSDC